MVKVLSSKEILKAGYLRILHEKHEMPSGIIAERAVVRHPGAVVVLPLTATGELVMIKQYRHAIGRTILEFPAGTLEVGEDPQACAVRELQEEAGFLAKQWRSLGTLLPAPGFCDEVQYAFFATELSPNKLQHDEDEIIETELIKPGDVYALIKSGELVDSKSTAVIARAYFSGLLPK